MKTTAKILLICITIVLSDSCKKNDSKPDPPPVNPSAGTDHYTSMDNFYATNALPMQHYTIDASVGGSFTTPQGTVITIAPNSFIDKSGNPVTGTVNVEFKDIYNKSDMFFSKMPTMMYYGAPLKSGGEFFIRVKQGNNAVNLTGTKAIAVQQPLNGFALDTAMKPFVAGQDTFGLGWHPSPGDSLHHTATSYVFSLYNFSAPADSGTWSNSDNSNYFAAYPQTTLTLHANDDPTAYKTDVFLLFKTINSMVHVYNNYSTNDFPYSYAPSGLQCTMVAVGVKDGKLYSSFVPITISSNLTVNFTLSQTTTSDFKKSLGQLNH